MAVGMIILKVAMAIFPDPALDRGHYASRLSEGR